MTNQYIRPHTSQKQEETARDGMPMVLLCTEQELPAVQACAVGIKLRTVGKPAELQTGDQQLQILIRPGAEFGATTLELRERFPDLLIIEYRSNSGDQSMADCCLFGATGLNILRTLIRTLQAPIRSTNRQFEIMSEQQELITMLGHMFNSADSLETILEELPRIIGDRFKFPAVTIALWDYDTDEIIFISGSGTPMETITLPYRTAGRNTMTEETIRSGKTILHRDIQESEKYRNSLAAKLGFRTFASVPMTANQQTIGAISLCDTRVRTDLEGSMAILQVIGQGIAAEILRNRAQAQAQNADKLAALGTLAGGLAHEINNPNTIIRTNIPLLREFWTRICEALDDHPEMLQNQRFGSLEWVQVRKRIPSLLTGIEAGAIRIDHIVSDLQTYIRHETRPDLGPVDLGHTIIESLELTQIRCQQKGVQIKTAVMPELPPVYGTAQRLEQVLINLITNACEACPETIGMIRIQAGICEGDHHVLLVIEDNGCGIAQGDIKRVTMPFFTTKHEHGNTGLGLAISAGIINEFAGRMEFFPRPGTGTIIRVHLPIAEKKLV